MSLGIYIHLPYCLTKCPYCDFNSYGVGDKFPEEDYTTAILCEIDLYAELLNSNYISTIFFGGGTPSLFKHENIEKIIYRLSEHSTFEEDIEITIEINPKTADYDKLKRFKDIGINRISVGIQSFSERKLKFYGRLNSPEQGMEVLGDISDAGFKNFNLDLIYGSTSESMDELRRDIEISLGFNTTHISAYCLTIEDGTQFGDLYKKGLLTLPDDDVLSDMFDLTSSLLSVNGFQHYEISNFCRPGYECRHNLIYWDCGSYIGFGAGAHSHLNKENFSPWGTRWANIKNPKKYMNAIERNRNKLEFEESLTRKESITDRLLMGLRLKRGVDIEQFQNTYRAAFDENKLRNYIEDERIEVSNGVLKITEKGRIYSNELIYKAIESLELLN